VPDLAHPKIGFSPFSFFSAVEIHKSELFWHILQDLGEYGRFWQIVSMEMRKTCFCPRKQVEIVNARSVDIWDLSMAGCNNFLIPNIFKNFVNLAESAK
jgi:hypothetical protein